MNELLPKLLSITLLIFMAGNLLEMGLKVKLNEVGKAMRNWRFIGWSLLWSFVLSPALALALTKIIPVSEPYAIGMLFLGMAPCAPFLPAVAQQAKSDLAYVATFMILTAVGTVLYMPFMVPVLVKGFTADAWTIAKPLVLFILLPLAFGVLIRAVATSFAEKTHPVVKKITTIDTLVMLVIIIWIYGKDFVGAIGSYAIATQLLFYLIITVASYVLSIGLPKEEKSALSLGVCTRNIGAAIAPLFSVPATDQRAIVMCAIAVPLTLLCSFIAAKVFGKYADKAVS